MKILGKKVKDKLMPKIELPNWLKYKGEENEKRKKYQKNIIKNN